VTYVGKRGPKPLPDSVLATRGSSVPRKRELAQERLAPVAGAGMPKVPSWLSDEERKLWDELGPTLVDMGIVSVADGHAFARYVHSIVEWNRITARMRDEDLLVTPQGAAPYQHPLLKIKADIAKELQHHEDRFGLTPAARMTLNVTAAFKPGYKRPTEPKPSPTSPTAPLGGERFFKRPG
jgi:P27 family predicted phage terminase small subunit